MGLHFIRYSGGSSSNEILKRSSYSTAKPIKFDFSGYLRYVKEERELGYIVVSLFIPLFWISIFQSVREFKGYKKHLNYHYGKY